jgi:MYXO-CTERM domain-containing protein
MRRHTAIGLASAAVALSLPSAARAHFVLQSPASWAEQAPLGDPQKSAPCGQADPGTAPVETGMVTSYAPGDTVTVTINETVTHPGHYRVVLSTAGQAGLPADPPVVAGNTPCGSTEIQNPPVFPVLADGALVHTAAFSGPQSFTFKIPSDVTCTSNCVLQVEEFMSDHGLNNPGGCFYHHCANVTIRAGAGTGGRSGDAGAHGIAEDYGCQCAAGAPAYAPVGGLVALLLVAARRRRRPD